MTWFTANVTLTNGQQKVDWNSGDPLSKLSAGDGLIVNGGTPLEILSVGSVDFLLKTAWAASTVTASVTAQPLPGDFASATENLREVSIFASSLYGQMTNFAAAQTSYVTVTDAAGVDYSVPTPKILTDKIAELGTAATKDFLTSTNDMTAGRLIPLGAGGYQFNKRIFTTKELSVSTTAPVALYLGKFYEGHHNLTIVNKGNSGYNTCDIEFMVEFNGGGTTGSGPHLSTFIHRLNSNMSEAVSFHSVKVSSETVALYLYYINPNNSLQSISVGYNSFTPELLGVEPFAAETWTPINATIAVSGTNRVEELLQTVRIGTGTPTFKFKDADIITTANRNLVGNWGGTAPTLITDFTQEIAAGTYRAVLSSAIGGPDNVSYNVTVLVENAVTDTSQTFIVKRVTANIESAKIWLGSRVARTGPILWVELYHSGNTNLNVFGGGSGDILAIGEAVTPTSARFYLPINGVTQPISITNLGSFQAFKGNTAVGTIVTGASITLNSRSSEKLATVELTTSGLVVGDQLELRADGGSSSITVNF